MVKLLEEEGWAQPRSFDAHPYRTTDEDGVWKFVEGCIRAYQILAEKVAQFREDPEIEDLLHEIKRWDGTGSDAARRTLMYERLDHLVFEILMGTRASPSAIRPAGRA